MSYTVGLYILEKPHTVWLILVCDSENSPLAAGTAITLIRPNYTKYVRHPGCERSPLYSQSFPPRPCRHITRLARKSSSAISYAERCVRRPDRYLRTSTLVVHNRGQEFQLFRLAKAAPSTGSLESSLDDLQIHTAAHTHTHKYALWFSRSVSPYPSSFKMTENKSVVSELSCLKPIPSPHRRLYCCSLHNRGHMDMRARRAWPAVRLHSCPLAASNPPPPLVGHHP